MTIHTYLHTYVHTVDPMLLLPSANPFKCHEEVLYLQPMIPSKRFNILPLTRECSAGLDALYDTANKNKTNAKPRFELSTVRARQHFIPARGSSARYAREFSSATCHDEAGGIILILLHC